MQMTVQEISVLHDILCVSVLHDEVHVMRPCLLELHFESADFRLSCRLIHDHRFAHTNS